MYRKIYQKIIPFLLLLVLFFSCKKGENPSTQVPVASDSKKVFVVCEGSLGNGNAALGMYDVDSNEMYEDVFSAVNQQSLGDIFQSIQLIGDRYFLCINNSDKIVVIDKNDFKLQGTIAIPQPRYILPVDAQKAYVSTIYSDQLYIINPQTLQVQKTITMPAQNAEHMLLWDNQAIVCTWDTSVSQIYYLDITTDTVAKSVTVLGKAPYDCLTDKDGMLWILSGDAYKKVDAKLTRINPSTGVILKSFSFPSGTDVVKPIMNNAKDSLYFIEVQYDGSIANNGVYRMGIDSDELPSSAFIAANSFQYFWAIGIEPETGNIFVGDPKGFSQKGNVTVYKSDGEKLYEFKTGVGPSSFYFAY